MSLAGSSNASWTTRDLPPGYTWLAANALERNIFFEPAILTAALQHLAPDALSLCVASDPDSGLALAAMPLRRTPRRYGPLPTPVPLAVWHHPYSMVGTPLVSPEFPEQALAALLARAGRIDGGPSVLLMPMVRDDGPLWPLLLQVLKDTHRRYHVLATHDRAGLHITHAHDVAQATLASVGTKKSAQSIRASRKKAAALGTLHHGVARQGEELMVALDAFLALEASGWKGKRGTALASIGHDAFARQAVLALAQQGQVRIDITRIGDTPIAGTLSIRSGPPETPLWMPWKTAFDERFMACAPGVMTLANLTEDLLVQAHAHGTPMLLDSLAGSDSQIGNRLWRQRWLFHDLIIDLKPGGSAAFGPIILAEKARQSAFLAAKAARRAVKNATASAKARKPDKTSQPG